MKKLAAIPVLTLSLSLLSGQSLQPVDSLFSKFAPNDPGCAVLVIQDGKKVLEKGYGVTDLRTHAKITPETNFRLASMTKAFTATAVMLLVRDGKLRYDERLTDIFPGFPAYGNNITVRQMLNHTSGLLDYEDLMPNPYPAKHGEAVPQIQDNEVLELLKRQTTTRFPPGTSWEYSNTGYVLLGLAVERRSGLDFGDFLKARIFQPLGMTNTIVYEVGKNEVVNRAYGHTQEKDGWRETDQSSTSATRGDGRVYSSLEDLAKWDRALNEHTLLSEKEMQPALTSATNPNGGPLRKLDGTLAPLYGFGWYLDAHRGQRRYYHDGETVAFRNGIQRFPDRHLTVIVLSNRLELDAPSLALSVADLYLESR